MALRAQQPISNRPFEAVPKRGAGAADGDLLVSESARQFSAVRGLLFAVGLSVPFWIALYLLLRLLR